MSARIATEPIIAGTGAVSDFRSRTVRGDAEGARHPPVDTGQAPVKQPSADPPVQPLPAPPPAQGAAFAVALITGQLAPRPTTELEIQMRLGSIELPPHGSLALADRFV